MSINKKQLASQLNEVAALLDVLAQDPFKAKAYQNAARNIENYDGDINELLEQNRLTDIRGVGKGLATELSILKTTDTLPILEDLHQKVPEPVRKLFNVSGLGTKKIAALWQAGIDSLQELISASEDGRLASMKGFGKKSAEKFATAAMFALESEQCFRLDAAEVMAAQVLAGFQERFPGGLIVITGELRRSLEVIRSLDFVVTGVEIEALSTWLRDLSNDVRIEDKAVRMQLESKQFVFFVTEPAAFVTTLTKTTGSQAFFESLQSHATTQGYTLNANGLIQEGADAPEALKDEQALFTRLHLSYVIPEQREGTQLRFPDPVIQPEDVRGLVHNHSTWSDAVFSIRDMVTAARERGYAYLAMADHSRTSYYANGLSSERVLAQAQEINEIRAELKAEGSDFGLLHGIEVDILPDGSLDYPEDILAQLDYTVISVHQNFTLSEADMTQRIINAVQNPHSSILGHMTGRLLLRRPAYAVDVRAVIAACAETGTVIEINANPYRLDLDWRYVIEAKAQGCKFSINPDAHHTSGFDDVRFGVKMAQKAGLRKEDVVNTAPTADAFLRLLKTP